MSKETKSKRFISIRLRLFLQVGAIVLIAVMLILALNKWYLSSIYILNQKRTMQYLAEEIDTYDVSAADYSSKIALLEKDNGVTIDVYMSDGTPLYYGAVPTGITGGKIVIKDRHDNPDGSFFEIQENAMSDTQFIVYGKSLKFGGDLEMYSKKTTIDSYADTAINVMLITSILALCATLVAIYFYSKKFTKPDGTLYDVLPENGEPDDASKQVRCNEIFALTMPFTMIEAKQAKAILAQVRRELYTPVGLRSLSLYDPQFHPHYGGTQFERDMAYHQGTVWAYPLGAYYRACIRFSDEPKQTAKEVLHQLDQLNAALAEGCLGQIAEIYDGECPAESRGCFAQAWSVAELLRAYEDAETAVVFGRNI